MNVFVQKLKQIKGLLTGLGITGKGIVSRHVTVYYPRETIEADILASYRGPIELVGLDEDPGTPRCISCLMCVQACPSGCITVAKSKAPEPTAEERKAMEEAEQRGEKPKKPKAPKYPSRWIYDFSYCSLCGCCVEACPADSIRFSHNIYLAGTAPEDFRFNLLARLRRQAEEAAAAQTPPSGGAS